ncbi:MAG: DNA-binding protein [Tannerellaceae bacterium]|jgi:predicted histone-like DNA-binding protein|nr:DNA-binding protein [Tannerellaceae bacterium]
MAIKFKLLKRRNMGKDKDVILEKVYAREVYSNKIEFKYLLKEISESGIPSNQVKGVIDRMNYLIEKHLELGHIVQFGEFGNFRYCLGSDGAETEKEFSTGLIRTPRLLFTPGSALREARKAVKFARIGEVKDEAEENGQQPEGEL